MSKIARPPSSAMCCSQARVTESAGRTPSWVVMASSTPAIDVDETYHGEQDEGRAPARSRARYTLSASK
jgi:hypothetical protein